MKPSTKAQATPAYSRKALETRARLKEAARQLINANSYSNVRVEDITTTAGVAKGLFYRYFNDLHHITSELCEELFTSLLTDSLPQTYDVSVSPYEWLCDYVSKPVERFVNNPGLLACMFELHGSFPDITRDWMASAHQWNYHLSEFIMQVTDMPKEEAERLGYILGAAMEGIVYQSVIRKVPDLRAFSSTTREITETVAATLYRMIFLEKAPQSKII